MTLYVFFKDIPLSIKNSLLGAGHSVLQLKNEKPEINDFGDITFVGNDQIKYFAQICGYNFVTTEEIKLIVSSIQTINAKQQRSQVMYLNAQARKELLPYKRGYLCTCKDCDVKELQSTSNGAINFIGRHAGHNTWVETEHRWSDNKSDARKQAEDAVRKLSDRRKEKGP